VLLEIAREKGGVGWHGSGEDCSRGQN
jgi:hypothetical protein